MSRELSQGRAIAAVAVFVLVLGVVGSATSVRAAGNRRPLSDWLSQQGTTSVFFPPVPDLVGQGNCDDPPLQPPRFALSDYTGHFAAWILLNGGPDLGTTVSGTVTEEPMADGRARVHVITHARNALTTVWDISESFPGAVIFGRSAEDVADGVLGYALGENELNLTFINTAPGAPLPNMVQLFGNLPGVLPGQEPIMWRYSSRAKGELRAAFGVPDGTQGRFMTSQTGLFQMPPHGGDVCFGFPDTFPVETMFLHALGRR